MSKPRKKMAVMAKHNDIEGITRLLDEGVDPAAEEERDAGVHYTTLQGVTALHWAAIKGFLVLVRLLVERVPHLLEMRDNVSGCVTTYVHA
jgi:hypothetical protein